MCLPTYMVIRAHDKSKEMARFSDVGFSIRICVRGEFSSYIICHKNNNSKKERREKSIQSWCCTKCAEHLTIIPLCLVSGTWPCDIRTKLFLQYLYVSLNT